MYIHKLSGEIYSTSHFSRKHNITRFVQSRKRKLMKTSKPTAPERRFLRPGEAAALLGVGSATLKRWALAGKIPALRLPSGVMRYDASAVIAALSVVPAVPAPKPAKKAASVKPASAVAAPAAPVDIGALVASLETAPARERVAGASLGGRR